MRRKRGKKKRSAAGFGKKPRTRRQIRVEEEMPGMNSKKEEGDSTRKEERPYS